MPALMGVQGDILVTSPPSVNLGDSLCSNPSGDLQTWPISNAVKRILDNTSVPIVQTSPDGVTWTTVSPTLYTIQYIGAIIKFLTPLAGGSHVRFHNGGGAYFPYASIGNTTDWQASYSYKFQDGTTHKGVGGESWADFFPLVGGGTITLKKWWIDQTLLNFMSNNTLLVLNLLTADGHYTGAYCYVKDSSLKDPPAGLIEGALTFQITGQIVYI